MNTNVGLQYGAYPPKIAKSIKCSIEEAQQIFDRYHNELYPAVTRFREEYVVPTVREQNYIHMGLGCYIHTDNPDRDIRTLVNSLSQFWSILSLLTINKMHHLIDEAGLQNDIVITSCIYDSVYGEVTADPTTIKWLNDTIIPVMLTDFMADQIVHNDAALDIGTDWATVKTLPHKASVEQIIDTISVLDC